MTALGGFFLTSGLAFYMHRVMWGGYIFIFGIGLLFLSAIFWFSDVINEATFHGLHTRAVRIGLRDGFLLFLVSEIMLFFGFFWAFFHSSICPAIELGSKWPPFALDVIFAGYYPLYNTILLIVSGFAVTWVHQAMAIGSFREAIDGFCVTIGLGLFFIILQLTEYYEASFVISDGIYASTFYLLTGLHGFHVMVGVVFLSVCFIRLLLNHFLTNHYLGLVFAIWYWHFVDLVWILLFFTVYCWGGW
jgi:cytochrome c oxidase subunit 3